MLPKDKMTPLQIAKSALRTKIKNIMKKMSSDECASQSKVIQDKLIQSEEFSKASRIAFYLNMPNEAGTEDAILHALRAGKTCFVPVCRAKNMSMLKVHNEEDLKSLPANSWGIREPLPIEGRENALDSDGVDLVVVPGVAFTTAGFRLGHGAGYYDRFLAKLQTLRQQKKLPPASLLALAFHQQIQDDVPTGPQDILVHKVLHG